MALCTNAPGCKAAVSLVQSAHSPVKRVQKGLRAWWWLPLPLPTTSTPESASAMCGEAGVNSSSHVSAASTASSQRTAASPIGHIVWPVAARTAGGRPCSSVSRGRFHVAK